MRCLDATMPLCDTTESLEILVAGCQDHAIKLVDIEKSFMVKQSIMLEHKTPQDQES